MILSGTFDTITNMLVVVIWFFYMLCFAAVFILRRREPDLPRPYKVPGFPLVPIIAMLGGVFIILTTLFTQPAITLIGVLITLAGVPIYRYQQTHHRIRQI
jgi:APA family basic amino acid/polyamine antiporter